MRQIEKRLLQMCVVVASIVPLVAGISGIVKGAGMFRLSVTDADLDSHFRYLSGLLLAVGLGYLSTVARIETHAARFRLLTFIVIVGGLSRAAAMVTMGVPSRSMFGAVCMELLVTPFLALWQYRISRGDCDPAVPYAAAGRP